MSTLYNILVFVLMSNLLSPVHGLKPHELRTCYVNCDLEGKLDFQIFAYAMESLEEMEYSNEGIVTIIDFSKPAT